MVSNSKIALRQASRHNRIAVAGVSIQNLLPYYSLKYSCILKTTRNLFPVHKIKSIDYVDEAGWLSEHHP